MRSQLYNELLLDEYNQLTDYKIKNIEDEIIFIEDIETKKLGFISLNTKSGQPFVIQPQYDQIIKWINGYTLCFINQNGQRRIIKLQDYHLDKLDYYSIDYLYGNYYKKS